MGRLHKPTEKLAYDFSLVMRKSKRLSFSEKALKPILNIIISVETSPK